MPAWGGSTADESKPKWEFLKVDGKLANTFADERGWVQRHPWGDEVLVAIGGLGTQLGVANAISVFVQNLRVANTVTPNIAFVVSFNEKVTVTGTPTLVAIGANGAANVTLNYLAAASTPDAGRLVFANGTQTLANGTVVGGTLTVNASSVLTGWDGILDVNANAVANTVVSSNVLSIVSATVPTQALMGTAPANTNPATLSVTLLYGQGLSVNTTPTLRAIGANGAANVTLNYVAASSNLQSGSLVFANTTVNLANATVVGGTLTINSTSTLTGFEGVFDAAGYVVCNNAIVANSVGIVAA